MSIVAAAEAGGTVPRSEINNSHDTETFWSGSETFRMSLVKPQHERIILVPTWAEREKNKIVIVSEAGITYLTLYLNNELGPT